MMFMPCVTTGVGSNRNHVCWNPRITSAFHWFWDSWPCINPGQCSRRIIPSSHLWEMVPTLKKAWESWLWWYVPKRDGSALCLRWVVPLAQIDQLSYYQDPHPWSWVLGGLAQPNIYLIYNLLEYLRRLVLLNDSHDWEQQQDFQKGVSVRVQWWWYARGQRRWPRSMTDCNENLLVESPNATRTNEKVLEKQERRRSKVILVLFSLVCLKWSFGMFSFRRYSAWVRIRYAWTERWVGLECMMWSSKRINKERCYINFFEHGHMILPS